MAPEKDDDVERAVEADQTDESQRDAAQPDLDPGVIEVEEEAIDVDAVDEEDNERKSSGDEDPNAVDLVSSSPGAAVQADVDVIDLEEPGEDGEDGEDGEPGGEGEEGEESEEGGEEQEKRLDDEDASREQGVMKKDVMEVGPSKDADHKDGENTQPHTQQETKQIAIQNEADDKQEVQASENEQKQPPMDASAADSCLKKDLYLNLNNEMNVGEAKHVSAVPPARTEEDRDSGGLITHGEDEECGDNVHTPALPQDDDKSESNVEKDRPTEEMVKATENLSQQIVQVEPAGSIAPENGTGAHGVGMSASETMSDVIIPPVEEAASTLTKKKMGGSGEKVASEPISDVRAPVHEPVGDRDNAGQVDETAPEVMKEEIPSADASMKEFRAIEGSEAKSGDVMDMEDAEEDEHENVIEEEHEHMDDENGNADMELSEEEPAHDLQGDGEQLSEPRANTNQHDVEITSMEADHKTASVPADEDGTEEAVDSGKQIEDLATGEVNEKGEGGVEHKASLTPGKEIANLKQSDSVACVQGSNVIGMEVTNAPKASMSDAPDLMIANLPVVDGKEMDVSTSDKKEAEVLSGPDGPDAIGGSPSSNLTAPLFGMRPSGFPVQPVSFRTPPSFQRTSLSPNARPFIPAAHREAMRIAALPSPLSKDEIASVAFPVAMDKEDAKETPAVDEPQSKEAEGKPLFSPQQAAVPLQSKSPSVLAQEPVSIPSTSPLPDTQPVKQSANKEDMAIAETSQLVLTVQPVPPSLDAESKPVSARKAPALKVRKDSIVKHPSKPQGKKVTFNVTDTKVAEPTEPRAAPAHSESSGGGTAESGKEGKLEEQGLKEEKSDDGFMYEVSHVPLSVRIGNGNVIKRGSLSTLRLTVAKSGEAKLDMFKEGASSLLLFESLSASRNILRVRKVSNRPIMTVTLMSNNNGGTQVAKKYYVHLGHHLYEKVFKACVAHLNSTSPDRRTGTEPSASATPVTKRLSTPVGSDGEDVQAIGTKRTADGARTADSKRFKAAERRRKLLETKAKLLENLKAARKNKASSGSGETDRGPDKPTPGASNLPGVAAHASTSKPPIGQVVPKTPLQMTAKSGGQKSATAISTAGPVKSADQSTQKTKPAEAIVHASPVVSEKRKHLAEKHSLPVRQKEVIEDKMQTDTQQERLPTSEGRLLPPPSSTLKRKKPASLSVQKTAQGKRAFDEGKSMDSKRQRTANEKSSSAVATPSATLEKLKALREQAKTGMGASAKGRAAASTSKPAPTRPSLEDMEEVKRMKSMIGSLLKEKNEAAKQATAIEQQRKKDLENMERLQKALSQANSETAESRKEATKLAEKRKELEKKLEDAVAAVNKSKEEEKELWAKVSDMLNVVNAAQSAVANDEDKEEQKKISLSRCDHNNVEDFFCRLRTFKPSTWPVEEADIGALACARHGWYNSGVNELKSSDGVTLLLGDLFENCEVYMRKIEEMKTALVQKHALLSGWRGRQCSRDIGKELLSREALVSNASELKEHAAVKRVRGFKDTSKNVCELMAACGWKACETGVRCEWCGVVVGEEVHLKESHYQFCMFFREEIEVRRNAELLGLDWEVEGARLGWFFRSTYGDAMDEG